jgi:hypothetical protein
MKTLMQYLRKQLTGQRQLTASQPFSGPAPRRNATKCIAMLKKNGYSPTLVPRKPSKAVQARKGHHPEHHRTHSPTNSHHTEGSPKSAPPPRTFALPTVAIADEVKRIE